MFKRTILFWLFLILISSIKIYALEVRIKDLCRIKQARENQLLGYGLVVGLEGSGDTKASIFTLQSVVNMLKNFGIAADIEKIRTKNVAAVIVSAELPSFFKEGDRIDVLVSTIGDAKDLSGGILIQTPLLGGDGKVYAIAQGKLEGRGGVCKIEKGAVIERSIPFEFYKDNNLELVLKEADFSCASKIATKINQKYPDVAIAQDASTVKISIPPEFINNPVEFIAQIENLTIEPPIQAKVVINPKTATVIVGKDVKINKVALSHKGIFLKVGEKEEHIFSIKESPTVDDIVKALNAIGTKPADIITILQALKKAGALYAEIVLM